MLILTIGLSDPAISGDWPQILGPQRDGTAVGERLADSWGATGPPEVWTRSGLGAGFAGMAVADSTLVLFHRLRNVELVEALSPADGKSKWRLEIPTTFRPSFTSDDGPRCVPLIHNGRVYVFGSQGVLACLELASGRRLWQRNTHADFAAPEGYFGAGSSPILEGNAVIVNVGGGRSGAGIVAFDAKSGKTLWKATDEMASYSSPVARTINGQRHVVFITRLQAVSLNPANGGVRFAIPFGKRGPTVNGANPVLLGDKLFLSASYGVGAIYGRVATDAFNELWRNDDLMSSQYATCVVADGKLYGIHGRQDVGAVSLRCIDPERRRVLWSEPGLSYGTLLKADGKLVILTCTGELVLARLDPQRYQELARSTVLQPTTRGYRLPALADGRLYIRDDTTLKCLDLSRR
jgi:outer membrane protein assembly factor BamB